MNFDLSEEQQLLADSLKRYLANEYALDARAKIVDSESGWSEKVWGAFAEMGLLGVPFAEEHGGFGGSAVDVMLVMEALGESLVVEPYWVNVGLAGRLVARGGSEAQQKRILPALIQGKQRLAFAHTERTARYDLAHVGTRAKRAGGGYTLEGEKRAVLHGGSADTLIVSARTGGGDTDPAGISLFLVERGAPGVTLKEYRTIDELRAADVWFSGVAVPEDARRGGAGPAADRRRGRLRHRAPLRGGGRRHPLRQRGHARVPQDPPPVRSADRQLPGPAAPHGGHGDQLRAGPLDGVPGVREGRQRAPRRAAPRGLRGQDQGGRRLPPREPGGGAAARGHGHDGRAEGEPHLPTAHHDRPDLRRRRASPGAVRAARGRLTSKS